MNHVILNTEIQDYIFANLKSDLVSLLLKKPVFESVSMSEIVNQIEAKKKCEHKLPSWYSCQSIYYPNKIHIEQSSSEITARYKSQCIDGSALLDLTGGFGVDSFYFSKSFKTVNYCETNEELATIVRHNFNRLNVSNISVNIADGMKFLETNKNAFDWIYIDPSRRHKHKGKVVFLADYEPDVRKHRSLLFEHTDKIMIKVSPMMDISKGVLELDTVRTVHIVAVRNEVKELLFELHKGYEGDVEIKTINLLSAGQEELSFLRTEEEHAEAASGEIDHYLYEPNAAILKSGAFKLVAERFNLIKLHRHTHLYTSSASIEFPGRRFKVTEVLPYSKSGIKKVFYKKKANIAVRHFPETVSQIRNKFKIKDGGDLYAFFTTDYKGDKVVILTSKA